MGDTRCNAGSRTNTRVRRAGTAAVVMATLGGSGLALGEDELNALVWCDHTDDALIEPFEAQHDVKVNLREYEGTGAALAILEQSRPGDWDVLVIDAIDVPRVARAGLLAPLPDDGLPTDSYFPEVVMAESNQVDGTPYAITEKFGYNTISFNADAVDEADLEDLTALGDGEHAGRIALYDYYLPMIGLVAVGLGLDTAELSEDDLPAIREELFRLKDASRSVGEVTASQAALATGEVDIVVGGGEWLTAVLASERPALTWTIPEAGAVRWAQSLAIVADTDREELALEFIRYVTSPEGQARLATSQCFWGMPANRDAAEHLTDEQKSVLRWDEQPEYLARTQLYPAPDEALDQAMQDLWLEVLQR